MPTLYELLGALPQDDADSLRAAFRKAAKASHPDNNRADPDAPQKFRQVVRAHAILKDETQRAAYDWLLAEAEQQRTPEPKRTILSGLPGPIGSMVIASVSIGAFVALERVLTAPVVSARVQQLSARAETLTAAMPPPGNNTVGRAGEKVSEHTPDRVRPAKEAEIPDAAEEIAAPVIAVTVEEIAAPAVAEPATPEPAVKDAQYYLERGDRAYRSGDFPLALTDFDLAIHLDPNFSDAYINRAIVFRRMGDTKRALADVLQAKRIDEGKPR
ncbi:MAG TPA: DnaJ domain-containing protein [Bradyrhizobium sp.]|uniref:DnaJ domain-containing protein n=1 Tax=Bradyrhizobium sp. TaxID=376 RepID=UPI002D81127D|nr:DnaJ domain-containing protein [Bradyrhizobium sp.]HET7886423.1 DnaJ domain-containing protein [Bradyrhizobium sp.]